MGKTLNIDWEGKHVSRKFLGFSWEWPLKIIWSPSDHSSFKHTQKVPENIAQQNLANNRVNQNKKLESRDTL